MCTSKAKQGIHSALPMDRHVVQLFLGKQASILCNSDLEIQISSLQMPLPSFFTQLYALSMMTQNTEYFFCQQGPGVLAVSTPSSLYTPSLLASSRQERQKKPQLCVTKTAMNYQDYFLQNPKHSPTPTTVTNINSIAAKVSTIFQPGNSLVQCLLKLRRKKVRH